MSGMDDLVTWLRAQLDDDERVARLATAGQWTARADRYPHLVMQASDDATISLNLAKNPEADAQHVARWDPARVLAEVDAKRRIIDALDALPHYAWDGRPEYGCPMITDADVWAEVMGGPQACDCGRDAHVGRMLSLLALPYADRPGYRDEWRP